MTLIDFKNLDDGKTTDNYNKQRQKSNRIPNISWDEHNH